MDEVQLYLVRVWRSESFRASVRVVGEEQTRLFESAAALGEYLLATATGRAPGAASGPQPPEFTTRRQEPQP